jgi:hypothetical protein
VRARSVPRAAASDLGQANRSEVIPTRPLRVLSQKAGDIARSLTLWPTPGWVIRRPAGIRIQASEDDHYLGRRLGQDPGGRCPDACVATGGERQAQEGSGASYRVESIARLSAETRSRRYASFRPKAIGPRALWSPIAGRAWRCAESSICLLQRRLGAAPTLEPRERGPRRSKCRYRHRELCDGGASEALVSFRACACLLMGRCEHALTRELDLTRRSC